MGCDRLAAAIIGPSPRVMRLDAINCMFVVCKKYADSSSGLLEGTFRLDWRLSISCFHGSGFPKVVRDIEPRPAWASCVLYFLSSEDRPIGNREMAMPPLAPSCQSRALRNVASINSHDKEEGKEGPCDLLVNKLWLVLY